MAIFIFLLGIIIGLALKVTKGAVWTTWLERKLIDERLRVMQIEAEIAICLDIMVDYDGYRTVEGLMRLIDEIRKRLADEVAS